MKRIVNTTSRQALRLAIRAYDDYQKQRIALGNRIKIKRNGEDQAVPEAQAESWAMTERDRDFLRLIYDSALSQEQAITRYIEDTVRGFPIWSEFLEGVKGCGEVIAAYIIAEYDIHEASTVSKMWQFTGLNPNLVRGKKIIPEAAVNSGMTVLRYLTDRQGSRKAVVLTDDMIRGDKMTKGYLSPFNAKLRVKMCGVLGGSFIKHRSPYRDLYDNMRNRLEHSEALVSETKKGGFVQMVAWKDATALHRHQAAIRYMVKIFLFDLYKAWRTLEGLSVRELYQEEYLGKKHEATVLAIAGPSASEDLVED